MAGLGRRVARLEGWGGFPHAACAHAVSLAVARGLDAADVLAGARAVLNRAAAEAVTARALAAWLVGADGRDLASVLAGAERAATRRGGRC